MNTLRLAWRMLSRDWRAGELTILHRRDGARRREHRHRRLLRGSRQGGAWQAGEPVAGRGHLDFGRPAIAGAFRDASARPRARCDAGVAVQQHGAARRRRCVRPPVPCSPTSRRSRRAIRCAERSARRSGRRQRNAARPGFRRAGKHGPTRASPRGSGSRSAIRWPSATRRSRSARSSSRNPRSRAGCSRSDRGSSINLDDVPATNLLQPGNRATYRLLVADLSSRNAARPVSRVAAGGVEARSADGKRPRPAPRSQANAGARRAIPRSLGARRGDPGRRRGGARGIALPAAPSRHRGDASLFRRIEAAGAHAVRAAVRRAGRARERRGPRPRAPGASAARRAPDVGRSSRVAATRMAARGDGLRHGRHAAVRLCACRRSSRWPTCRRCAFCGATCRDRSPAESSRICFGAAVIALLIAWQAQDAKAGAIMIGGIGGLLVVAAFAAWLMIVLLKRLPQRGATWRFGLANLRRRPLASSLQIGALALGFMALLASHRRARRSDAELAREHAARCAQPLRAQRAARPDRRRARGDESGGSPPRRCTR